MKRTSSPTQPWLSLGLLACVACGPEHVDTSSAPSSLPDPSEDLKEDQRQVVPDDPESTTDGPSTVLAPTRIRLINSSGEVRSRRAACSGDPFPYYPKREGVEPPFICAGAPVCSTQTEGAALPSDGCSGPACLGARVDLQPGAVEEVVWQGTYREASAGGCWHEIALALGAPLRFRSCWGKPSGEFDIVEPRASCIEAHFAYGDEVVEVELK